LKAEGTNPTRIPALTLTLTLTLTLSLEGGRHEP
jgi:hypothetical protein